MREEAACLRRTLRQATCPAAYIPDSPMPGCGSYTAACAGAMLGGCNAPWRVCAGVVRGHARIAAVEVPEPHPRSQDCAPSAWHGSGKPPVAPGQARRSSGMYGPCPNRADAALALLGHNLPLRPGAGLWRGTQDRILAWPGHDPKASAQKVRLQLRLRKKVYVEALF